MKIFCSALRAVLLIVILTATAGADTTEVFDTTVVKHSTTQIDSIYNVDTVHVFDTSYAVQKQIQDLRAEMYDKAMDAIKSQNTAITVILTIIGIMIAAFSTFLYFWTKGAKQEVTKDRSDIAKLLDRAKEDFELIHSKRIEVENLTRDSREVINKKGKGKDSIEERIKQINEADAREAINRYKLLLIDLKALGLKKEDLPPELHKNIGQNLVRLGLYQEALDELLQAEPYYNEDDKFLLYIGYSYSHLFDSTNNEQDLLQAIEHYRQASEIDCKNDNAFYNWGVELCRLYELKGDERYLKEALKHYHRAAEIDDKDEDTLFNLACAYSLYYDKEKMLLYLRKAIDIDPKWKTEAINDIDFGEYRNDPDFIALVGKAKDDDPKGDEPKIPQAPMPDKPDNNPSS